MPALSGVEGGLDAVAKLPSGSADVPSASLDIPSGSVDKPSGSVDMPDVAVGGVSGGGLPSVDADVAAPGVAVEEGGRSSFLGNLIARVGDVVEDVAETLGLDTDSDAEKAEAKVRGVVKRGQGGALLFFLRWYIVVLWRWVSLAWE